MMAQNRAADMKISRTPAGAPPSGTSHYTCFDGTNRTVTGRNNFAGVTYVPTASNKGAAANASVKHLSEYTLNRELQQLKRLWSRLCDSRNRHQDQETSRTDFQQLHVVRGVRSAARHVVRPQHYFRVV